MLALGEALAARGHDVALQTWRRWRGARRRGGDDVRCRARVPGLPDPRAADQALRGGGRAPRAETVPAVEAFRPDLAVSDILTAGARARRGAVRRARGDARPARAPWSAPGFPPFSIGARLPRTRARRAGRGGASTRSWRRGSRRAATSTTAAARGSGCRRCPASTAALSRAADAGGDAARSSSTRAAWAPWLRVIGPLLWEPPGRGGRAAAGRRARWS